MKELQFYMNKYYIFTEVPAYRHLSFPDSVKDNLENFKVIYDDFGAESDLYYMDQKIPLFDLGDGNMDLLDLSRYDKDEDDCPVIYYDHEMTYEKTTLFPSVKEYLSILTKEFESGDYMREAPDDYNKYIERLVSRGNGQLQVLLKI